MLDEYHSLEPPLWFKNSNKNDNKQIYLLKGFENKLIVLPNRLFYMEFYRCRDCNTDDRVYKLLPNYPDLNQIFLKIKGDEHGYSVFYNHDNNNFIGLAGNPVLTKFRKLTVLLFKKYAG